MTASARPITIVLTLAALCAQTSPCQIKPPHAGATTTDQRVYLTPQDFQAALGKALANEVDRSSSIVDDSEVLDYLNRLAARIAADSHVTSPITIHVIDTTSINAFTLPGGFQYVNRALILQTASEAELAGVLARCLATTTIWRRVKKSAKNQLLLFPASPTFNSASVGAIGQGLFDPPGIVFTETDVKSVQRGEAAADYLGLQYLYAAGYDPEAMLTFLERVWPLTLAGMYAGMKPAAYTFSPYPPLRDRLKAMRREIQKTLFPRDSSTISSSEFEAVTGRLRAWRPPILRDQNGATPTLRRRPTSLGVN